MIITIHCEDIEDAIDKLEDVDLEELEGTEEGDMVYTSWGTLEV